MDIPSNSPGNPLGPQAPQDAALYQPFVPLFLTTSLELTFPVFARTRKKGFQYACQAGQTVSLADRDALRTLPAGERFYVLREDSDALLQYQETTLAQILGDKATPIESRCEAFHSHLTSLLRLVFQMPTSLHVYRLRVGAEHLVHFFLDSSDNRRPLWTLSHRRYTSPTHSLNVGLYGLALAMEYFGQRRHTDWIELAVALFLHDIGKTKVHPATLEKSGPLDQTDWREIKQHPGYGQRILETLKVATAEASAVVLQHHERMDGLGYPYALAGRQIHPYARICSIADAFDALTTQRTFRSALNPFDTLRVMKEEMQTQFDPDMFRMFVLMLRGKLPTARPVRGNALLPPGVPVSKPVEPAESAPDRTAFKSPGRTGTSAPRKPAVEIPEPLDHSQEITLSFPASRVQEAEPPQAAPPPQKRSKTAFRRQEIQQIVKQLHDVQKTIEKKEEILNAALEKQAHFRAAQKQDVQPRTPAPPRYADTEPETSSASIPESMPQPGKSPLPSNADEDFKLWPSDLLDR
jgi:HD-GYP domain-containing protein (c-di-GMP phosphodiesterase class II)